MWSPSESFRNPERAKVLLNKIRSLDLPDVSLMEVCGSHTMAISRFGIKSLLPPNVQLLSGPGCPVCVTGSGIIDAAIALSKEPGVIFATFADMLRVPGSLSSLAEARAAGGDIRLVYSPLDALDLAQANPDREVILLAIGFETTAPAVAATILTARERGLNNFSILQANKTVPPALRKLLDGKAEKGNGLHLDGLILPGHVAAIIGRRPFDFIPDEYSIPGVITGFETVDILQGIYLLLKQITDKRPRLEIQYRRGVSEEGNPAALAVLDQVFQSADGDWRGLGLIPSASLVLREEYREYDAVGKFNLSVPKGVETAGCRCGEVLRGLVLPTDCPLFGGGCTPERPAGACMVSMEGTCAAYYRYGR